MSVASSRWVGALRGFWLVAMMMVLGFGGQLLGVTLVGVPSPSLFTVGFWIGAAVLAFTTAVLVATGNRLMKMPEPSADGERRGPLSTPTEMVITFALVFVLAVISSAGFALVNARFVENQKKAQACVKEHLRVDPSADLKAVSRECGFRP